MGKDARAGARGQRQNRTQGPRKKARARPSTGRTALPNGAGLRAAAHDGCGPASGPGRSTAGTRPHRPYHLRDRGATTTSSKAGRGSLRQEKGPFVRQPASEGPLPRPQALPAMGRRWGGAHDGRSPSLAGTAWGADAYGGPQAVPATTALRAPARPEGFPARSAGTSRCPGPLSRAMRRSAPGLRYSDSKVMTTGMVSTEIRVERLTIRAPNSASVL